MSPPLPQPDELIQPVRVIADLRAFQAQARAGGVEDLVEFRAFYTRDLLLFGAVAGPEEGELVILLHGFPDFWLSWTRQIPALVEAGYRVIIPDQRGYHRSEKPADIDAYQLPELGQDILDIIAAAGREKAHLVGHDWGGGVAWWLAQNHPESFSSVSVLNCPHPAILGDAIQFKNRRQMVRSWYIAFFQLPKLPELFGKSRQYAPLKRALTEMSYPGAFTEEELAIYEEAWSQDGALRGMVNWYRAARRKTFSGDPFRPAPINVPLQIIWGVDDAALHPSLVEPSADLCTPQAPIHWDEDAGHWIQRDNPMLVNEQLLRFFDQQ